MMKFKLVKILESKNAFDFIFWTVEFGSYFFYPPFRLYLYRLVIIAQQHIQNQRIIIMPPKSSKTEREETDMSATTNRLLELEELTAAQKVKLRAAVKKGKSIEEERNLLKEKLEEEVRVSEETRKTSDILIEQLREQVKKMDGKVKVLEAMKEATTSSSDNNDKAKKEEKVLKEKNEQLEAKAKEQEVSIARLESEQKAHLKETDALQREKTRMSREIDDLKAKLKEQKDAVKVSKRREADALVGGAALETAEKKAMENEQLREKFEKERDESLEKYEQMKEERDRAIETAKTIEARTASLTKQMEEAKAKFEEDSARAKDLKEKSELILREAEHRIQTAEASAVASEQEAERMMEEAENRNRKFQHLQVAFQEREAALHKKIETLEMARDDRVEGVKNRLETEMEKKEEFARMYEEAKTEVKGLRASMGAMESNVHAAVAAREHATTWKEKATSAIAETDNLREKIAALEEANIQKQQTTSSSSSSTANAVVMEKEIATLRESLEVALKQKEDAELRAQSALNTASSMNTNGVNDAPGGDLENNNSSSAHQARKLAESEHTVLKQQTEIQALTRRVKDLSWQVSMYSDQDKVEGSGNLTATPGKKTGLAAMFGGGGGGGGLANLKGKRRQFVVVYLGVLHLLVYVAFLHGAFSAHKAVTGCRRF